MSVDSRDALVPAHGEYALVPSGPASQPAGAGLSMWVVWFVRGVERSPSVPHWACTESAPVEDTA